MVKAMLQLWRPCKLRELEKTLEIRDTYDLSSAKFIGRLGVFRRKAENVTTNVLDYSKKKTVAPTVMTRHANSHRTTNWIQRCLTSVIIWEPLLSVCLESCWYEFHLSSIKKKGIPTRHVRSVRLAFVLEHPLAANCCIEQCVSDSSLMT